MIEEKSGVLLWDSPPRTQIGVATLIKSGATNQDSVIHDKAVGHVYGSDNSVLPSVGGDLERYGRWACVASTVYNKLYQLAKFDPSVTDYKASSFANLRYSFASSPFWNTQFSIATRDISISRRDCSAVVGAINSFAADLAVPPEIESAVVTNVRQIAQLATAPSAMAQKQSLLCNATIAVTTGLVRILLLYAIVSLELDRENNKYQAVTQDIKMVLGHGVLDLEFCTRHASDIVTFDAQTIEDWQNEAAANSQPVNMSEGWPSE